MFCEKCGCARLENVCMGCRDIKYYNPIPVAISLVQIQDGEKTYLLGVRRGIEPKKGEIAFPGGFQEIESVNDALLRELKEETGVDLSHLGENAFHEECVVISATGNHRNLMFYKAKVTLGREDINWDFKTSETQELILIDKDTKMAFPLHEQMIGWGLK